MGAFVTTGAQVMCSFGLTPCPLVVNPARTVFIGHKQKANIMDFAPITNLASFGMCSAPTNPTVISATAAAMGVFTPMPCVPAITAPWMPGYPQVLVQGMPALTDDSRTMCMWLGQISITFNGQFPPVPPICTPPLGKPNVCMVPPLSSKDFASVATSGGGGGGESSGGKGGSSKGGSGKGGGGKGGSKGGPTEKQYKKDIQKAKKAGQHKEMMAKSFDDMAKEYERQGDSEKAQMCLKKSEKARYCAADMRNEAESDVNQCYRDTLPPAQKEMEKLPPAEQEDYWRKRKEIEEKGKQESNKKEEEQDKDKNKNKGGGGSGNVMRDTARKLDEYFRDEQTQEELRQLKEDTINKGKKVEQKLEEGFEQMQEKGQELLHAGKEAFDKGKETLGEGVNTAKEKGQEAYEGFKEGVREGKKQVGEFVNDHKEDISSIAESIAPKPLGIDTIKNIFDF